MRALLTFLTYATPPIVFLTILCIAYVTLHTLAVQLHTVEDNVTAPAAADSAAASDASPSSITTPPTQWRADLYGQHIAFIYAHPDDEVMFFLPTILAIKQCASRCSIYLLCLSTGNSANQGKVRTAELLQLANTLQIPERHVWVVDDRELPDSMSQRWSSTKVAQYISIFVKQHPIDTIITFDEYGVSGHLNHQSVHHGVKEYMQQHQQQQHTLSQPNGQTLLRHRTSSQPHSKLRAYRLVSEPLVVKYSGAVNLLFQPSHDTTDTTPNPDAHNTIDKPQQLHPHTELSFVHTDWQLSYELMSIHASQFVWYRRLFIYFSSYTYLNTLLPIQMHGTNTKHEHIPTPSPQANKDL